MLTISRSQVNRTHGPACTCRACNDYYREFNADQRLIDERLMREHLERRGYYEPCDLERTEVFHVDSR